LLLEQPDSKIESSIARLLRLPSATPRNQGAKNKEKRKGAQKVMVEIQEFFHAANICSKPLFKIRSFGAF
jgi:hypothetical protein